MDSEGLESDGERKVVSYPLTPTNMKKYEAFHF